MRAARRTGTGGLARAGLAAVTAALLLTAAACGGSGGSGGSGGGHRAAGPAASKTAAGYNEGLSRVVQPSGRVSAGTLTFDLAGTPDSTDYQNTDDMFMWDFARLYSMQLMTYKSCPAACGLQLVPGLATGPGVVSDHGLIWTYHLRPDVRFENGQPVTAADVKYGIERSYARGVLPYGPDYFRALLQDPGYPGPYARPGSSLTAITTPNASTIQFHLVAPFADFDDVVATPQSTPVLPGWDAGRHGGANFQLDPVSTGPYQFASYTPGRQLVLVRNPYWNPAADGQARQLVRKIVVNFGLPTATVDADLLAGRADVDLSGGGLSTAAAARLLGTPAGRSAADDALTGTVSFSYVNTEVIGDLHCREAIEYAADKTALQQAYGGADTAAIAGTVLPPEIAGYQPSDDYRALSVPGGDLAAARQQLALCGKPHGFSTGIAYRSDHPQDVLAARALARSLARVGIATTLHGYRSSSFYLSYAGNPGYASGHDLGLVISSWAAQWPDGYAFLDELSDGSAIAGYGDNANIAMINDSAINSLFARSLTDDNAASRAAIWPRVDARIMALAAIVPIADRKALLYRPPGLTNVYVDATYGMYNYAVLGLGG